ncbi:Uncharacterized protein FKW44_011614, partial [Caligus rogercresseyi]
QQHHLGLRTLPPPTAPIPSGGAQKEAAVNTDSNQLNSIVVPTVPLHPGYLCPCQLMLVKRTAVESEGARRCLEESFYRRNIMAADEDEDDEEGTTLGEDSENIGQPGKDNNNSFSIKDSIFHS